jgi:hypothetical protein
LFQRVLGGNHEKRLSQPAGFTVDGHLTLAHRFQQSALGFRGRPVDLVCQQDLRKNGAGVEHECTGFTLENRYAENVSRQHVAGALNPAKIQPQHPGQNFGQGCLADAGQIFYEKMPPRKETGQGQSDLLFFAADDRADLPDDFSRLEFRALV